MVDGQDLIFEVSKVLLFYSDHMCPKVFVKENYN